MKVKKSRTTFRYFECPNEVTQVVQDILSDFQPLVDRLVDRVNVFFEPDTDGEAFEAAIRVRREYRAVDIFISGYFMQRDEETRREALIHELCHILTDPLYKEAEKIVENFVPDELQDYVFDALRCANEVAVDDFSRVLVDYKAQTE